MLAGKVHTENDELVSAGIRRRAYLNWSSRFVVIAKANGGIRQRANNKRVNEQSIIPVPVLPIPTVSNYLSDLGGSSMISMMDLVSGFVECAKHADSIPLTAVCTKSGVVSVDYVTRVGRFGASVTVHRRHGLIFETWANICW